jgi:hypothetical protein
MTHTTPNEREDWAKTFLEAGTKEIGMDLSVLVGVVSEIVSRTRQEEREKVVEYIKANSALTDNPIESNSQLIDCSYYQIYAGALEQARNLT